MTHPESYIILRAVQFGVNELNDICGSTLSNHIIGNIEWLQTTLLTIVSRYLNLNKNINVIIEPDEAYNNFEHFNDILEYNMYAALLHLENLLEIDDYNTSPTLIEDIKDAIVQADYILGILPRSIN